MVPIEEEMRVAMWTHMLGSCSQKKNKLKRTPKGKLNDAHQYRFGSEP